jgi:RNA polymerase sigma factor (TIGR02999 family)
MSADRHEITSLLRAWTRGDAAAGERLFPLVYDNLRQMARRQRRGSDAQQTLSTTGLVHEAYMRLVNRQETGWRDRAQFFALASKVMRGVLVDQARRRQASKRGGDRARVTLLDDDAITEDSVEEILTLHDALKRLEEEEPRKVRVVECRFFGGLAVAETAEALGVSVRTVEREWREARLYLYRVLRPDRFGDDHS